MACDIGKRLTHTTFNPLPTGGVQSVDGLILCQTPSTSRRFLETMDEWNMPIVQAMRSVSETKGKFERQIKDMGRDCHSSLAQNI